MPYSREKVKMFEDIIQKVKAVTEAGGKASRIKLIAEIEINYGLSKKNAEDAINSLIIVGRLVQEEDFITSAKII